MSRSIAVVALLLGACSTQPPPAVSASSPALTASPADSTCPYEGPPLIDPGQLPDCCDAGGAHCLPTQFVPAGEQTQLTACTSSEDYPGYCVPDQAIETENSYIPETCFGLLGAEGRCTSVCVPRVAAQAKMLPVATCRQNERCVPCYDPRDGSPTGACSQSCDPGPSEGAREFTYCCGNRARCVPRSALAGQNTSVLDSCGGDLLCVPSELLDSSYKPRWCEVTGLAGYEGVCLSDCLDFGTLRNIFLRQGSCPNQNRCVPCTNPATGDKTGAPGCP